VLPGAVTLLGLVGLLRHGACARSSPSGLGVPSIIDPRRHVNAPIARSTGGARPRPADHRSGGSAASNVNRPGARRCPVAGRTADTPRGYRGFALRLATCGATFRPPKPRRPALPPVPEPPGRSPAFPTRHRFNPSPAQ
jgi:hypothetical protein